MTKAELAALTSESIDFDKKTIYVTRTLVYQEYLDDDKKQFHFEDPKTVQSKRVVPINHLCEVALKKQYVQKKIIERRGSKQVDEEFKDLLFTTKFNTPLNSVIACEAIKRIVNEINLMRDPLDYFESFSAHTFRHTFATRCIESGVRPKTVQMYLGHATLQMTMDLYVHVTDDCKAKEMLLLENELLKLEVGKEYIEELYEAEKAKENKQASIIPLGVMMA